MTAPHAEWTVSELKAWLLDRRRRPRRSWSDWYYLLLAAAILLPMGVSLAAHTRLPLLTCASSTVCGTALGLLPFTWVAMSSLAMGAISSLLGPLAATTATASWILSTPLDREDLLSPGLTKLIVVGLGVGLLSGCLLWAVAGGSPLWIAVCTSTAALAVLAAVLAQQGGGWHGLRKSVAVAASWALLGALALTGATSPVLVAVAATACATLLAWRAAVHAKSGLRTMSRFSLAHHSETRTGLAGAASGADAGLALDIVALKLGGTAPTGALTTRRTGWHALAGYEVSRLVRRSPRLLWGVAIAVFATAFIPVHPTFGLAAACVVLVPALGLMLSSLRTVQRSRGLSRALGLAREAQVSALATGAALASGTWAVVCCLVLVASGLSLLSTSLLAWAVAASGLAGAMRWAAAPPPNFAGGVLMTDVGPVPVTALLRATAGFDVAFTMATLLLVGTPPVLCAVLAGLALGWSVIGVSRPGAV
ncbi:MAG: hypothetical protein IPJ61_02170 [Tessaracoccus sp.]|uniref:DUF6297 family protein n=1 Tax=Tessaracoccus sp. TaxID=1971211 RepID=UPI001ECD4B21|nr:DUF6297 family protein [Tessaracoccus sp.]MBK7819897.1 hypothetical protein [Tessaracoccus sp.]